VPGHPRLNGIDAFFTGLQSEEGAKSAARPRFKECPDLNACILNDASTEAATKNDFDPDKCWMPAVQALPPENLRSKRGSAQPPTQLPAQQTSTAAG
jgi:hypothetical protein